MAEPRGFEPLRVFRPIRFPGERNKPTLPRLHKNGCPAWNRTKMSGSKVRRNSLYTTGQLADDEGFAPPRVVRPYPLSRRTQSARLCQSSKMVAQLRIELRFSDPESDVIAVIRLGNKWRLVEDLNLWGLFRPHLFSKQAQ